MSQQNHNTTPKPAQAVIVDVPVEVYQADLVKGLQADETLQPGRYTFRRGGFLQRYGEATLPAQPLKIRTCT